MANDNCSNIGKIFASIATKIRGGKKRGKIVKRMISASIGSVSRIIVILCFNLGCDLAGAYL